MKNPFSIALAVAVISLVGSIQSEASTLSPTGGQLGTNPQNESFSDSNITCQYYCGAGNQNGFGYLGYDTFSVTISGTGLQPLDLKVLSSSGIAINQGFNILIPGVQGYGNQPIPFSFDYKVDPGTYTITFVGALVSSTSVGSLDGTITAGDPPSATPLPAALPLFATGLGALGLLGWRRKRKGATAMAS
jgi:hypothetical protein